ncbi:Protein YIPF6 [Monoraphidium neglectum]|uniref:Protein YIPF6 n=1 Tax=Monoraphidium neglectum TaxID=145388 RepID=A0A0D2JIN1_9CHLO|nr:Protein YIPF6 [Monoraphidium neglectum]KIY99162.1 Protein YIPF6 [Monoraphidium neglectum]|eukprot:XP_013898182.1 Protein YIPF6 [Monoraphidium neglectum]
MAWPGQGRPEAEQRLFEGQVPSVPSSSSLPGLAAPGGAVPAAAAPLGFGGGGSTGVWVENTLDEPVWATLRRDVYTIGRNMRSVLIPIDWDFTNSAAALGNWDLWGPLIFMLGLAITLSAGEKKPSDVFALVFTEVALGAVVLTINVILLGGDIVFFQSMCLIGYCLFPINIAAIVCLFVKIRWVRLLVLIVCLVWASAAAVPFISKTVVDRRRALAVYPVLLMYTSIGWLALTATLLEQITQYALRARLREARSVTAEISCDAFSLLAGRVNSVTIKGEGWRSPLDLTAQTLEATVGAAALDYGQALMRREIVLTNVPTGTARVVFSEADLGNFLAHPLVAAAAQTAVQGAPFVFDRESVRIEAPSRERPEGVIFLSGTWRRDNVRYQVELLPVARGVAVGRGVHAHAIALGIGGRSTPAPPAPA